MGFRIKQHDNKSALRATLKAEGRPVNLLEVRQVRFLMMDRDQVIIDKPVYVVDAVEGKVWFPFEKSETEKAGTFKGEFHLEFLDGREETFPNFGTIPIEIIPSLKAKLP